MISVIDARWLALAIATEDSHPVEQKWIGRVIRNRKEAGYRGGESYRGVVLTPWQFSHFNPWTTELEVLHRFSEDALFAAIVAGSDGLKRVARRLAPAELWDAAEIALGVLLEPWPFPDCPPDTLHFYAPRSMRPAGSEPSWAKGAKRLWTPQGCDPERLVLAQGVA